MFKHVRFHQSHNVSTHNVIGVVEFDFPVSAAALAYNHIKLHIAQDSNSSPVSTPLFNSTPSAVHSIFGFKNTNPELLHF
jgi:hypothetical protein